MPRGIKHDWTYILNKHMREYKSKRLPKWATKVAIVKPKVKKETEIQGMKLFAAGYRPIHNTVYPRIGCLDIKKLRRRCPITPLSLRTFAGRELYCSDIRTVHPTLYYTICRLSNQAYADPLNKVYTEMAKQYV
jgi:hypothetical protein